MAKVKICGITNLKDALFASHAGADALGFVFYPHSKRYITPQAAQKISSDLPPLTQRVGLFVNTTPEEINEICRVSQMHLAQIHFEVDHAFVSKLTVPFIRVIRVKEQKDLLDECNEFVLVDAFVQSYGGEGKRINIDWFKDRDNSKTILAGGLSPSNISGLTDMGFYGFDVSSGVEISAGKKDLQKVASFIQKAKELVKS